MRNVYVSIIFVNILLRKLGCYFFYFECSCKLFTNTYDKDIQNVYTSHNSDKRRAKDNLKKYRVKLNIYVLIIVTNKKI